MWRMSGPRTPSIAGDGTLIAGNGPGMDDYAVNARSPLDGSKRWAFSTGAFVYVPPVIDGGGTVYIWSDDMNVYALDATTGGENWLAPMGTVGRALALGADGTLYAGFAEVVAIGP